MVRLRQSSGHQEIEARCPAHDDLVKRVFTADRPNQLWLTGPIRGKREVEALPDLPHARKACDQPAASLAVMWSITAPWLSCGLKRMISASASARTLCPAGQWKTSPVVHCSVVPSV